jgi:hypothetical protein
MQINILILFLNNQSKYLKYIIILDIKVYNSYFSSRLANRPKPNPKSSSSPLSLNSSPHSSLLNPIATSPHSSTLNSSDDLTSQFLTTSVPFLLPLSKRTSRPFVAMAASSSNSPLSRSQQRRLSVLLFDVMDTIVQDPFYHHIPAFFDFVSFFY